MAIYHLRVKYLQRSKGRSGVAAAAYRSGGRLVDERTGEIHDYSRKRDIEHDEILLPDHLPVSLSERTVLWNTIETGIKHPRGQPAFEVEVALPRELTPAQCVQLVRDFATDHFVKAGLPVDFAIHRTPATDGGEHPHAHILICSDLQSSVLRPALIRHFQPELFDAIGRAKPAITATEPELFATSLQSSPQTRIICNCISP